MNILTFYKRDRWLVTVTAIFIILALAIAYQPVMFNFFCSDDFYIISWLDQCKQNFSLLFQTVYEGTPYYRPLLNLLLFIEYCLCGPNSILFRGFSLLYLLITAYILWLLVGEFANELNGTNVSGKSGEKSTWAKTNWCLFSVGFFLLFPLHTEPINWFVSTTELLVNIFILASFLFFIYWRNRNLFGFQFFSYLLAACALLTKETAVILPPILFVYELLVKGKRLDKINHDSTKQSSRIPSLVLLRNKLLNAIRVTANYWFLLVIYFCLRKMMTGDFLGNWSNAVFHFSDNQAMFKAWFQSIKIILNPISWAAFGKNFPVHVAWTLMLIDLTFLTLASVYKSWKKISLLLFFVCWFFISLIPMAKLLLITSDLLDARYGYIASIPLCIFLMLGLAFRERPLGLNSVRYLIFIVVISFCCFVLRLNNSIWAEAGDLTNKMLSGFRLIHKQIPNAAKIYFINIPVRYKGVAIAGIKSMDSMNHKPFSADEYNNCVWLQDEDQCLPIGLMAHDLEAGKIAAYFYYLSRADKCFYPVRSIKSQQGNGKQNLGTSKRIRGRKPTFVFSPAELKCQSCDALVFNVNIKYNEPSSKDQLVRLTFANDANQTNDDEECVLAPFLAKEGDQTVIFPLRGKPIWSFGGRCYSIKVSFPKDLTVKVNDAFAVSITDDMPKFELTPENYSIQGGVVDLNSTHSYSNINYDASFIRNCAGVVVEIIDWSEYFRELNSPYSEAQSLIDLHLMKSKGQIQLDRNMFKGSRYYKVRLRPVDKAGKQCAYCSDHFILHVSN